MSDGNGRFVICIKNEGYLASLEPRKIYRVLTDGTAESKGMLRIVSRIRGRLSVPGRLFCPG